MFEYSLQQDLQNKKALFYKLKNTGTYQDTAKNKESLPSQCLLNEKKLLLSHVKKLHGHVQNILFLFQVINFCLPALDIVRFIYKIYDKIQLVTKLDEKHYETLYDKIVSSMQRKKDVTQLKGEDEILYFLQRIGLSEAHYKLDIEKWLDNFLKYENFGDKSLGISLYMLNSIHNKFSYLYDSKFTVDSEKIRDELKIIFNFDIASFLVEDYQWFGLYVFVVYKVLDRFLRTLSHFKNHNEFSISIQPKNYKKLINTHIVAELSHFSEKIIHLSELSNNVMFDIPHEISYAKGLQYLQKFSDEADNFKVPLSNLTYKALLIKQWNLYFGISEINILSLLDLFREKFRNKIQISLHNVIEPKSSAWYKNHFNFYYNFINEHNDSSFICSDNIGKKRDLQIFLEYFSADELPSLINEYLLLLIYYVYALSDVQHAVFEFKNTVLVNLRTSIEEKFLDFINKKQKGLTAISNKKKLYDEYFLLFYQIADTSPFFAFLSVEQRKQIDSFQEICKKNCVLFEKQHIKIKPIKKNKNSIQKIPKPQISESVQKPILLDKILPELIAQLTKLKINIFKSLDYIEELADAYKSMHKLKILIDRFKSALGQIYAAKFFLKKFLHIESDVSLAVLCEKLIQHVEMHDKKNQNGLKINLLKKEIAPCLESVAGISAKIKEFEEKLIALKQKKEVLMLGGKDKCLLLSALKEIAQDLKIYEFIKEQLAFLCNLMRILSLEDLSNQNFPVEYAMELEDFTEEFKKLKKDFQLKHSIIICTINNGLLWLFYYPYEALLEQNLQTVQARKAQYSEKAPLLDKEKLYSDLYSEINNLLKFMSNCYRADSPKVEVDSGGYSLFFFQNLSSSGGIKKENVQESMSKTQALSENTNSELVKAQIDACSLKKESLALRYVNLELSKRNLKEEIEAKKKDFFDKSRYFIKSLCLNESGVNGSDPEAIMSKLLDVTEQYSKLQELIQAYVLIIKEQEAIQEEDSESNERPATNFFIRNTLSHPV